MYVSLNYKNCKQLADTCREYNWTQLDFMYTTKQIINTYNSKPYIYIYDRSNKFNKNRHGMHLNVMKGYK
jgi:hypothetical protein